MPAVSKLPCHYVDFLRSPGLGCTAGTVALSMYMGAHKNGEKAASLFDALVHHPVIRDTDTGEAASDVMSASEWAIMRKGQGNDVYFRKLWSWLWDNQEQLRDCSNATLKAIYAKYFAPGSAGAIQRMVGDAYFGIECIGFVSNYLRYVGVWSKYLGVDNHHWRIHFPTAVNSLKDIQPLDLLEWEVKGHVALIDDVYEVNGSTRAIAVSQCSGFDEKNVGPMSTTKALLTRTTVADKEVVYDLGGEVPVSGAVKVRRMPGLVYLKPDRPWQPSLYPSQEDVVARP